MPSTNYTISGSDFLIKTQYGEYFQDGGMAIVQWELGYNPKYRPMSEWTTSHLTQVSWTAWYVKDYQGVGQGIFGSNGTPIDTAGPLYLFIDFNESSNFTTSMSGQVWLGQITDILTLPGGDVNINLNQANLRPVIGSVVGNELIAADFNSWQPTSIPEPSYAPFAAVLLAVVLVVKAFKKPKCEPAS